METERGRIAVGWLIVEDLAMVLALVLLPALAGLLGGEDAARPRRRSARRCRFGLGLCGRAAADARQGRRPSSR